MAAFEDWVHISYMEHDGARFRVAQGGSGHDIVWVPGGDAPAEYWVEQFSSFHGGFRCTSFDPRGVGETTSSTPPWTMRQFAADCARVIEEFCDHPVILIGLSMGGLITQQVAIDFPHLVRLAIPMGTAAKITGYTRDWMEAEIEFRRQKLTMTPEFAAAHYAAFAYPAQALGDEALWERIKAAYTVRFADRDPEMLIAQWQACLDFDCSEGLATCSVPIHAVAFAQDIQTPPAMVKKVADLAADGHFHLLEGMGHVSFARHRPNEVNAYLAGLIRDYT